MIFDKIRVYLGLCLRAAPTRSIELCVDSDSLVDLMVSYIPRSVRGEWDQVVPLGE